MLGPSVLRWAIRAVLVHSMLLVVSGSLLVFFYRPTAAEAWQDIYELQSSAELGISLRRAHRWLAWLWLPAVLLLAAIAATERFGRGVGAALGAFGLGLAASITGYLLPWDQLALWSVRIGENVNGYLPILFGDDVRFVLIDGAEVSLASLRIWFVVHTAVGMIACLLPLAAASRRARAR